MDYKEEYQNALERAKKGLPIDEVFPELKESEDERIRKEIHAYLFNTLHNTQQLTPRTNELERWLAYLEKQKEYVSDNFDDVWTTEDCAEIIEAGEKLSPRFKELFKEVCHAWYDKGMELEKQKEPNDVSASTIAPGCWQGEQKPVEWSEEDEYKVDVICKLIEHAAIIPRSGDDDTGIPPTRLNDKYKGELKAFIKAIRPQPKAELTLLDENIIDAAVAFVEQNNHFNFWRGIDKHTVIKALRSLKHHWKPSEEQMEALERAEDYLIESDNEDAEIIGNLYNDLKKLK